MADDGVIDRKVRGEHLPLTKVEERANELPCPEAGRGGTHLFLGRSVIRGVEQGTDRCVHCDRTAKRIFG